MASKSKKALIVHKLRLYPTQEQITPTAQMLGNCRFLYNELLSLCKEAYELGCPYPGKFTLYSLIPHYQELYPFLKLTSVTELRHVVDALDQGYQRFFQKIGGFPNYKKRSNKQSMTCSQGVKIEKSLHSPCGYFLTIEKLKNIPVNLDKRSKKASFPTHQPKKCTITKTPAGEYYASLTWEVDTPKNIIISNPTKIIGYDDGILTRVAASYGKKLENPKVLAKYEKDLIREQRKLARCKKGSKNKDKQRVKVARIYDKIKLTRKFSIDSFVHHEVRKAKSKNQAIAIQTTNKQSQQQSRKLAKALSDACGGYFVSSLKSECLAQGVPLYTVSQWCATTPVCHRCMKRHPNKLALSIRHWRCTHCGIFHDRDINAAKVIAILAKIDRETLEKMVKIEIEKERERKSAQGNCVNACCGEDSPPTTSSNNPKNHICYENSGCAGGEPFASAEGKHCHLGGMVLDETRVRLKESSDTLKCCEPKIQESVNIVSSALNS